MGYHAEHGDARKLRCESVPDPAQVERRPASDSPSRDSRIFFMRERFQRFAIYWTPAPETAMAEFGALWFGGTGTFGLPPELAARATKAPAVYGLHATFKAPFRLKDDVAPEALRDALDDFCANRRAPAAGRLILDHHQHYLTLMLSGTEADIDWLAAECVTRFDRFRAPPDEEDDARRELDGLSPQEEAFLKEFGYPYVLSAFRFHISLAGPLDSAELDEVAKALEPYLASFMREPFEIKDLSLLGEPRSRGVFEVISRHRFGR
jgi:hypothetical protein